MSDLLVVKNVSREGPGLIETVAAARGVSLEVIDLETGKSLPNPAQYRAVAIMGGQMSANDSTPSMQARLHFAEQIVNDNIPCLGVCLGLEILVKAAGGQVVASPQTEVGFFAPSGDRYTLGFTEAGQADPLLLGLPPEIDVFELHGEAVEPTPDMQTLAHGPSCPNQIVRVANKAYGILAHIELTADMLAFWADQDPELAPIGKEKLLADFAAAQPAYTDLGKQLISNFLTIAGFDA